MYSCACRSRLDYQPENFTRKSCTVRIDLKTHLFGATVGVFCSLRFKTAYGSVRMEECSILETALCDQHQTDDRVFLPLCQWLGIGERFVTQGIPQSAGTPRHLLRHRPPQGMNDAHKCEPRHPVSARKFWYRFNCGNEKEQRHKSQLTFWREELADGIFGNHAGEFFVIGLFQGQHQRHDSMSMGDVVFGTNAVCESMHIARKLRIIGIAAVYRGPTTCESVFWKWTYPYLKSQFTILSPMVFQKKADTQHRQHYEYDKQHNHDDESHDGFQNGAPPAIAAHLFEWDYGE